MDGIITPLRKNIESSEEKINSLTKLANNMKSDLKAKDSAIKYLKCEKKGGFFKVVHQYVWYWLWDGYSDAVL